MKNEKDYNVDTIGGRIKYLREKKKNMKQEELAKAINASREKIVKIEGGKRDVQLEDVPLLASALDTSCDYLLTGIDKENMRLSEETGLKNEVIERLADLTVMSGMFPEGQTPATREDWRRLIRAQQARDTLNAINFLLSHDDNFDIAKLIYTYVNMNFEYGVRWLFEKNNSGEVAPVGEDWSEQLIQEIAFWGYDKQGNTGYMHLPVSLMENYSLEEIKERVRTMKSVEIARKKGK